MIFHIAELSDWRAAQVAGDYRVSTRGRTLADEGFIHASRRDQVLDVANAFYGDAGPLVLLSVDPARLSSPVRDDEVAPGVVFPHIYGPIQLDAVVSVAPLDRGVDGSFVLPPGTLATYFDGWYADMVESPVKDEIMQRHLGLPSHLLSTSSVGWDGIAEVVEALRLSPGDTLLDLACGRGGYGLEIAARTGARLVGVDLSAEAVRQAREQARRLGSSADFRVGDQAASGLDAGSVDGVLCIDAIQFAEDQGAAYRELRRVLAPGGRAVLTCWEPLNQDDERLLERLRRVDLRAGLTAAGFDNVAVRDRPAWRAHERAMWEEAVALDPGDDPALRSFHDEGVRSLETFDLVRRVMATATAPPAAKPDHTAEGRGDGGTSTQVFG